MPALILFVLLLVPNVAWAAATVPSFWAGPGKPLLEMIHAAVYITIAQFILGALGAGKAALLVRILGGIILVSMFIYYLYELLKKAGIPSPV